MKKTLRTLLLILTWILFPPVYIFLIFKNKTLKKRTKIVAYISVIASPFTLCLALLITILILLHQPSKFSVDTVEETLNIKITDDFFTDGYDVEKNTITYFDQDFTATVVLKLSKESFKDVKSQIERSPFFNTEWQQSDTVLYRKVRDYLEKEHLTGYWIKKDNLSYEFYAPTLSDIPNSAILFHEGFDVIANLSLLDRTLNYKYIKY